MSAAITQIATTVGVDRNILARVVWNESRGNINVGMDHSNYSAGVAQISRTVLKSYSNLPFSDAGKSQFYKQNITVAASYLKDLHKRFGSWKLAMEAYNQGPTAITKVLHGRRRLSPITARYVSGINN